MILLIIRLIFLLNLIKLFLQLEELLHDVIIEVIQFNAIKLQEFVHMLILQIIQVFIIHD